ncbi:MAG: hypothetical protein V7752_08720 [Halopseudomonas sp.]
MLRWLLLILLLLNGLLYGWFYQEQQHRKKLSDRVERRVHGVPELDLISEVPESALRLRKQEVVEVAEVGVKRELYCYRFGVFKEARGLEAWLGDDGPGQLELEQRKAGPLPSFYQVYVTPSKQLEARRELVQAMQNVGLEGEWVKQGELRNKLSLGVYQERASAQALERALQEQGYAAAVWEQQRFSYDYYLLLRTNSNVVSDSAWVRSLLQKYPTVKSEKKLCQGLATSQGRE